MNRRPVRIAAAVGAVALIGASVFGLVSSAMATPPNPPAITTPGQTVATGTARLATIDGTWSLDDATLITVSDAAGALCSASVAYTDPDNSWSCTPTADLVYGLNTLSAVAFNGETSDPSNSVGIVRTPPTPTIDAPANSGTTNPSLALTGTIDNPYGQHFTVAISDTVNGTTDPNWCQADVGVSSTTWSCNDTLNGFGAHTFTARAWVFGDPGDVSATSPATTQQFGDTTPATTINTVPESTNQRPTFSGTGPAGGTEFLEDGSPVCAASALVDAGGNWTCTADHDLGIGAHTLNAHATYAGGAQGDVGTTTFTVDFGPPTLSYSFGAASITATVTAGDFANANTQLYQGYGLGSAAEGCPSTNQSVYSSPTVTCSFGSLSAGIWRVYSGQQQLETNIESQRQSDFVRIPETPTLASRLNTDHTVTVSGRGTAGDLVTVSNAANATVCSATVAASGAWSCTVTAAQGSYTYTAIALSQGFVSSLPGRSFQGYSAYSPAVRIVVPAPTAVITYAVDFTTNVSTVTPGDTVTFTGSGPPGATVAGELHSTPIPLGSTVIGPDGRFVLTALIPMDVPPGAHEFVITVTEPGQTPVVVQKPVTVQPAPITNAGKQTPTNPDHSGLLDTPHRGAGLVNRNDPAAPSSLTNSLPTLQTLLKNPIVIGAAAAAGLALLLFVAFPAELLNSTLSENYERIFGRIPTIRVPWHERLKVLLTRAPITGGLVITVIAAIIFGFADPRFGFDLVSLRLVLACAIALFIVGYVASAITGLIVRRRWHVGTVMELKPLGLVLTIVGVLLSRIIGFSPGFLVGLILGLSLSGSTTVRQRSNTVLVRSGIVLGMAVIAWLVMSALGEPDGFGTALTHDTLAGIVTEGLTALVVGLLPFRYLDGALVFRRSRIAWTLSYLVALVAFCVIVLPSTDHWTFLGSTIGTWIIVVVVFAALTVGLYIFFRERFRSTEETVQEKVDEDNAAVGGL